MFHDDQQRPTLTTKSSFFVGLISGVLVICTIGFFILLGVMLKGGSVALGSGGNGGNIPLNPSPSDLGGAPAGDQVGTVKDVTNEDHIRGNKDAKVTLIEYSDYECPFCSRFHPVMQQIANEYGDKVRWVYRHFPLSIHPNALPAANAAECASEQGKFWEYSDALFVNQTTLGLTTFNKLRDDLKLNKAKFDECFTAKKYNARILADEASGSAANVTGTPGTIVLGPNGYAQLIPGALPYESVKQMVDAALAN